MEMVMSHSKEAMVGIFSLGMPKQQLINKMIAAKCLFILTNIKL